MEECEKKYQLFKSKTYFFTEIVETSTFSQIRLVLWNHCVLHWKNLASCGQDTLSISLKAPDPHM